MKQRPVAEGAGDEQHHQDQQRLEQVIDGRRQKAVADVRQHVMQFDALRSFDYQFIIEHKAVSSEQKAGKNSH